MVHEGLEEIAGEEIKRDFGGEVKKTSPGVVVFRPAEIRRSLLRLKTTEDLFVLAWGTDQLTYRAEDLDKIRRWTEREADWQRLLQIHHGIRPKPQGKPSYRLVVQMNGTHGYRRLDARKALARGLTGKLPASWRHVEENASIEIWLTINETTAVCGIRLSDRTMRHRTYKFEHFPASLRPTVAAAMVRLAEIKPGQTVLDPMCGAGTLLAETWLTFPRQGSWEDEEQEESAREPIIKVLGGDIDGGHVRAALANLRRLGPVSLQRWDTRKLPLEDNSVHRILCNPPFGKQLSTPEEIRPLYRDALKEMDRVLQPGGRAVLLVADVGALREAVRKLNWKQLRMVTVRVLGQRASILVYRKGESLHEPRE
jgi:tRNA (guanine6-N2)-methyltransferase